MESWNAGNSGAAHQPLHASLQSALQSALEERGLPRSGRKPVLAQRLSEALAEERAFAASEAQAEARAELERQCREAALIATSRHETCSHMFCCVWRDSCCAGIRGLHPDAQHGAALGRVCLLSTARQGSICMGN